MKKHFQILLIFCLIDVYAGKNPKGVPQCSHYTPYDYTGYNYIIAGFSERISFYASKEVNPDYSNYLKKIQIVLQDKSNNRRLNYDDQFKTDVSILINDTLNNDLLNELYTWSDNMVISCEKIK